jgi:uncharacterized membrane protein YczE
MKNIVDFIINNIHQIMEIWIWVFIGLVILPIPFAIYLNYKEKRDLRK